MKEGKPLAKHLCFMIRLDPQSLSCVKRSETFLEFAQDIFVHGITSSKIGWIFEQSIGLCQTLQSIPETTELHCESRANIWSGDFDMP